MKIYLLLTWLPCFRLKPRSGIATASNSVTSCSVWIPVKLVEFYHTIEFIQCTASMTSKCFLCSLVNIWGVTPDGAMTPGCHCLEFDSWWFLRKQRWGFLVCCWFQETWRNKMWRVVIVSGTCGNLNILSKKVKGGTHSQRETLGHLLRNEGKQRRFVYIRRLHLLHCCVFLFVKDHKIPVETMIMKCLRCVNGIRLRWLQSSFSKFLKTCVF